jgi:hypothetical protein
MANSFRYISPKRTCTKTYKNYRSFKPHISKDFNNRCGYSDCSDFWFGGVSTFHIDHFKPFSKNPTLETTYSNLVYCCSYVNILKSDDEGDYIDPCDVDFNDHFERSTDGSIKPKTGSKEAVYMFKKLKLNLARYRIIWMLDEIISRVDKLGELIENTTDPVLKVELKSLHSDLAREQNKYIKYLRASQ